MICFLVFIISETTRSSRQKPRWGRFMQSFCCCVTPQGELAISLLQNFIVIYCYILSSCAIIFSNFFLLLCGAVGLRNLFTYAHYILEQRIQYSLIYWNH
uniref:7TM_GPCR_Srx domain-containing protein n=1 Tax=Heterorhabditis bacteriophora TaxID=37862 RepID=A0A1I7X3L7_HETBA